MTESQVTMGGNIVCAMQTCQWFATRKTTFPAKCDAMGGMIDPPEVIGARLEGLRLELKFPTQTAFADALGIDKSTYNLYKTGARPLTFETACLLRRKWNISIDWLFFGDLQQGAMHIMARIDRDLDANPKIAKKPKPPQRQRKRA